MEKLSRTIQAQVEMGNWKPVSPGRNSTPLSHLLFADDLLLFTEASLPSAANLEATLSAFGRALGLSINKGKSSTMFSGSVMEEERQAITHLMGFPETVVVTSYLGFPAINGRVRRDTFQFIVDRMTTKLSGRKRMFLNKAGRTTLARSVLAAVPFYYMQAMWIPEATCNLIDKTLRNFIWKDSHGHGIHLVKWSTVAQPRSYGGLGLRRARHLNIAFLGKLVADLVTNKETSWVSILRNSYKCRGIEFTEKSDG